MQTTTPHAQRPAVASSKFTHVSRACGVGKAKPINTASEVLACLGATKIVQYAIKGNSVLSN